VATLRNSRHERFALALVAGKNCRAAYMGAGYTARGASAGSCATRLRRNVHVSARIVELQEAAAQGAVMNAVAVLQGLSAIARTSEDDRVRRMALVDLGRHYNLFDKARPQPDKAMPGASAWDVLLGPDKAKPN
jgi:hypothetical protein